MTTGFAKLAATDVKALVVNFKKYGEWISQAAAYTV
jgi:hypothetical protein